MSRWWWKRTAPSWCKPPCGAQPFLKDNSSAAARTALFRGDSLPILSPLFHPPTLLPLCPSLWLFHAFLAAVVEEHELGKCVSAPQRAGAAGGPGRAGDTEGRSQPPPGKPCTGPTSPAAPAVICTGAGAGWLGGVVRGRQDFGHLRWDSAEPFSMSQWFKLC